MCVRERDGGDAMSERERERDGGDTMSERERERGLGGHGWSNCTRFRLI